MSRKSFVNLTDGIVNVSMLIIQIKPRRLHRPTKPFKRTIHGRRFLVYSHFSFTRLFLCACSSVCIRVYTRVRNKVPGHKYGLVTNDREPDKVTRNKRCTGVVCVGQTACSRPPKNPRTNA